MGYYGFTFIKADLHQLANLIETIESKYIEFFHPMFNAKDKALFSLCKQMTIRSKEILYLINLNYKSNNELVSGFQNIDGTEILLRSVIEASIIYNILLNNEDSYSEAFITQCAIDSLNIHEQFRGTSLYFVKKKSKDKYDRFSWAQPLAKNGEKIYSIEDLLHKANLTQEAKDLFMNDINLCNSLSHPNLINDSYYIGQILNGNASLPIGVITTLTNVMYGILQSYQILHQYRFASVAPNYLKYLPELLVLTKEASLELAHRYIEDFQYDYLNITKKSYDSKITHAERIMACLITYATMTNIRNDGKRLDRSIQKLLDQLTHGVRELVYGFEKRMTYIYLTKIRFVLETLAMIWILLDYDEEQVEVYQTHTDIKTYLDGAKVPVRMLESIGITREDMDNIFIDANGEKITIKESYKRNVIFIKDFMKTRFNLSLSNKEILKSNAWMIDSGKSWDKSPSNMKYVSYPMKNLKDTHIQKKFYFKLDYYIKGLYSFSSTYCHPTFYSAVYDDWSKLEGVMNESYYVILTYLDLVLEKINEHYPIIKQLDLQIYKEFSESLDIIFTETKNYVNINTGKEVG